jgi:hypothetical protein
MDDARPILASCGKWMVFVVFVLGHRTMHFVILPILPGPFSTMVLHIFIHNNILSVGPEPLDRRPSRFPW